MGTSPQRLPRAPGVRRRSRQGGEAGGQPVRSPSKTHKASVSGGPGSRTGCPSAGTRHRRAWGSPHEARKHQRTEAEQTSPTTPTATRVNPAAREQVAPLRARGLSLTHALGPRPLRFPIGYPGQSHASQAPRRAGQGGGSCESVTWLARSLPPPLGCGERARALPGTGSAAAVDGSAVANGGSAAPWVEGGLAVGQGRAGRG